MTAVLKSLVALGYLNYHRASRTYFPTTRVAALGDWINHSMYGDGQLLDMMCALQAKTDETVTLVSQNDLFIQYIRVIEPAHPHKFPPAEGKMRVLTQSSGGLVLMSRMSDAAVDKLVRHINFHEQERGKNVDIAQVLSHLAWIRREGYCFLAGTPIPGASAVAMPLPGGPHSIPLAIGVGGINMRISRHKTRIVGMMREAIASYEAALQTGGNAPEPAELADVG
jgi:DNA-binding IclR family transcriptional regulator